MNCESERLVLLLPTYASLFLFHLQTLLGVAWLGPIKSRMFSVTAWNCATGYFTFGHGRQLRNLHVVFSCCFPLSQSRPDSVLFHFRNRPQLGMREYKRYYQPMFKQRLQLWLERCKCQLASKRKPAIT